MSEVQTKTRLNKITEKSLYNIKNNYKWRNIRNVPKPFNFPEYVKSIDCEFFNEKHNEVEADNIIKIKISAKTSEYIIVVNILDRKPDIYVINYKNEHYKLKPIMTYIKSCVDEAYELFYDNNNDANDYYYDDDFPEENIPNYI